MSQREPPREDSLQAKLDSAFRQTGLSHRQLARLILGENAEQKPVDYLRSQISKWRNTPGVGISAPNSAKLARGFAKAGLILPADHFLAPADQRGNEIEDLRRRVEDLERLLTG